MKVKDLETIVSNRVKALTKDYLVRKSAFYGHSPEFNYSKNGMVRLHKSETQDEKTIEFQKRCDDMYIASIILKKNIKDLELYKSFRSWLEDSNQSELAKAMDTATSGSGAEWTPTEFSRQLEQMIDMERLAVLSFPRITMPTNPYKQPGKKSHTTAYRATSEASAVTASSVGTRNITWDAEKLMVYVPVSEELTEDSIVAILPTIKEDISQELAYAEENCLINGDTTKTMDSDLTSDTDQRVCWNGLRYFALTYGYTKDMSTFTSDNLAAMMGNMGKYASRPSNLRWLFGTKVAAKLLNLRDVHNNSVVITNDKLGPNATIVKGQLGSLYGAPCVPCETFREDLNSAGKYNGTATTKAGILLVNVRGFKFGDRRKVTIKTQEQVKTDSLDIVGSERLDFQPVHDISTEKLVYYGYNITP